MKLKNHSAQKTGLRRSSQILQHLLARLDARKNSVDNEKRKPAGLPARANDRAHVICLLPQISLSYLTRVYLTLKSSTASVPPDCLTNRGRYKVSPVILYLDFIVFISFPSWLYARCSINLSLPAWLKEYLAVIFLSCDSPVARSIVFTELSALNTNASLAFSLFTQVPTMFCENVSKGKKRQTKSNFFTAILFY